MSFDLVRKALVSQARTILTSAPILLTNDAISADNMPAPKVAGNWCIIHFMPNDPVVGSLGTAGLDRLTGILAVAIRSPLDQGEAFGLKALDSFRTTLFAGKQVTFSGQEVEIINVGKDPGRVVDTWYRTDITVQFRAYIVRGS
jgi:hypothetical protein